MAESLTYNTILIFGTIGMLLLTTGTSFFIYLFQRKLIKRKIALQEIADLLKKQELNSAYAILDGQEKERKRIAEDLHDNLGSMLVTLNMYADALLKADYQQKELVTRISEMAGQATEETRKIAHNLHSGLLKHFGLRTAVNDLTDAVHRVKGITIQLHTEMSDELPYDVAVNMYRIIQELIHNTLKHSAATSIRLELTAIPGEYINLIYEDNGSGFSVEEKHNAGLGLTNITARVQRLNGQLTIHSQPGHGTSFIVEIPLANEN